MIICGLGNPGKEYEKTRHNIGFMVVDSLASDFKAKFKSFSLYEEAFIKIDEKNIFLVKPLTYMNHSGLAVKEHLLRTQNFESEVSFLVVVDDINFPFGVLRLSEKGSDGGHRGLANIIYYLETNEFPRLRVGIGKPVGISITDYVLSDFNEEEKKELPLLIKRAKEIIECVIKDGLKSAMNRFNRKEKTESKTL